MLLRASTVITPSGPLENGEVEIGDDGRIAGVRPARPGVSVPDRVLAPGFVELQVNGLDDVDCSSAATPAAWERLAGLLRATGVTSWCPTLVTAPLDALSTRVGRVAEAMRDQVAGTAQILGAHIEGPFLGGAPGAHPREWLLPIDLAWLRSLPLGDVVRVVTLAPELEGAVEAIEALTEAGVLVSAGHTHATYDQAIAAADAGVRLVTHLFNGMSPLHHRQPGLVGAALTDPRLVPSLIADGVHVHPAALALAARAKGPGRWVLVTDAIAWNSGRLAERRVSVVDGAPRLPDGTLAGSALTMDAAVRRMVVEAGVDLAAVVAAASSTPARLLGLTDRGAIEPGLRADLVALTPPPDLVVEHVWIA